MQTEVERQPKNTVKVKVTIPKERVRATYDEAVAVAVENIEVPGFRKGKAPRPAAEGHLDQAVVRTKALEKLLDEALGAIIKEHHLHPVVSPRVEINHFEPDADFVFSAVIVERPVIKIGDYKKALADAGGTNEKTLYGPDGSPLNKKPVTEKGTNEMINKGVNAVLSVTEAEIADILVDDEVNQMLSRLVDQTGKLGLTIEEYLKSAGKTAESLKTEYRMLAEKNLKTGLMLSEVASLEKIRVEDKEIDDAVNGAPDPASRKNLGTPESRLYIETVLRNNKTVQRLISLMETLVSKATKSPESDNIIS